VSHPTSLVGTTWRLVSLDARRPPDGPDLTIDFSPTDVSGEGGCNSFGGQYAYRAATGELRLAGLVSTKRACVDAARNDAEAAYFGALDTVDQASIDPGGRLVLSGSDAVLVFEVGPQPVALPPVMP